MRSFVIAAVLSAALVAPSHAAAQKIAYGVRWGSLPVARVEFEVALEADSYRAGYRARSAGILDWLHPFASEGQSEGRYLGASAQPERFSARSSGEDYASVWRVEFDPAGQAVRIEAPPSDATERSPVPPELKKGPDPLALGLTAIAAARPGLERSGHTFDGRRALAVSLACADAPSADGLLACDVQGRVLAGGLYRRASASRPRPPTRVWLAQDIVAGSWWPVRVEAETRWGTVTAELAEPPARAALAPGRLATQ
jgi:hypothetical protein